MDLSTLMPQQLQIVKTLDRPLFVSAGAGSGKTFTLTRRIVYALSPESGPFVEHLDQVLAITFTKDAAAEIRDRVRRALIEEGMDEEALAVDDAWISTIHGMCSRILRAHALELGIDPEFKMLEVTDELMDKAVDRVMGRVSGGEEGGLSASLDALFAWYPVANEKLPDGSMAGGTTIKSLVCDLLEFANQLPGGLDDVRMVRGACDTSALTDAYRDVLGVVKKGSAGERVALAALDAIDVFEQSGKTWKDAVRLLAGCDMPRPSKNTKTQVDLLKAEASDAFINILLSCGGEALDGILYLARAVQDEYRALKAAGGWLDNNDLLRMAYVALRDHPSIRAEYEGRFKMVMIDEFQDTDQMQVDLIRYLTGPGERALCTVGDAQQSIYRFRGAEVEVFRRQERKVGSAVDGSSVAAEADGAPSGELVKLVRNFRSHDEVLRYVARVFDGEDGGLMKGFLDLESCDGRKDSLVAEGASRRQAFLVVGGNADARAQAKARVIAERFRKLADAGQPQGDMVILLGGMKRADIYAQAIRDQGLDCVIAGGSVFADAPEVSSVRALVCALANPADTAQGLMPLLTSPMFALGAQELLALATRIDPETGETSRRNIDAGIYSDEDAPGFGELPLLARARKVLRCAFGRVGHDPFSRIARDVVSESGWIARLAARGPEGKAVAANVLKALDAVAECELMCGNAPRQIAVEFDWFLRGKEAPGALNEGDAGAVRIMTVHSSKGLEYPIVAVAECFNAKGPDGSVRMGRTADGAQVVALPRRFDGVRLADGSWKDGESVKAAFKKTYDGSWLTPELIDDVCASGSPAEVFARIGEEDLRLALEERARLLYVAMTRAREMVILAMDAGASTSEKKGRPINVRPESDLTYDVLCRILPTDGQGPLVGSDRLVFDNSVAGDYELIALADFSCGQGSYETNARIDAEGQLVRLSGDDLENPSAASVADSAPTTPAPGPADAVPDHFELVYPAPVGVRMGIAHRPSRDSYSYSSIAKELHAEAEDRAAGAAEVDEADAGVAGDGSGEPEAAFDPSRGDPTALGSAFHAACQWLIETGSDTVPERRADALARYWGLTDAQRERLDAALKRWCGSAVRRELLAWPRVMAEVPFFSLGCSDEDIARFGEYAEGAIDALGIDPADPTRALVIDYKTGGSATETPDKLQEKHTLQARVYADVLHRAGYARVTLKFVRVEIEDPANPGEPQAVLYNL